MTAVLEDWRRPWFKGAAGTPFLFYVAHGHVEIPLRVSGSRYRVRGIPAGLDIMRYGPDAEPDVVSSLRAGHAWEHLERENPRLAEAVAAQPQCVIVRGELQDSATLNAFRDVVGLLTYFLDSGCVALHDAQMLKWWSAPEWRERVFEPAAPVPRAHVAVLYSDGDDGTEWIHTRGLRKFGRPDVSLRGVPRACRDAAVDLCNRLIELQALGGSIEEGEEIRLAGVPPGMRCHHQGSFEDPDFDNVHIALDWPA